MTPDEALSAVQRSLADIAPEVDLDALPPGADLRVEADLDSMDFLRLLEGIAARTGVDVPEADYPRVRSVDGLVAYLSAAKC